MKDAVFIELVWNYRALSSLFLVQFLFSYSEKKSTNSFEALEEASALDFLEMEGMELSAAAQGSDP